MFVKIPTLLEASFERESKLAFYRKVLEFENSFSTPQVEKSVDFRKNGGNHRKVVQLRFFVQILICAV